VSKNATKILFYDFPATSIVENAHEMLEWTSNFSFMDIAAKAGVSPETGVYIITEYPWKQLCAKWILPVVEQ
jgi:hypothetical protein